MFFRLSQSSPIQHTFLLSFFPFSCISRNGEKKNVFRVDSREREGKTFLFFLFLSAFWIISVIVQRGLHTYTIVMFFCLWRYRCWCTGWFNGHEKKTVGSIQKIMLNVRSSVACHVSVSSNVSTVDCQAFRSFNLEIITNKQIHNKERRKSKSTAEWELKLFLCSFFWAFFGEV